MQDFCTLRTASYSFLCASVNFPLMGQVRETSLFIQFFSAPESSNTISPSLAKSAQTVAGHPRKQRVTHLIGRSFVM